MVIQALSLKSEVICTSFPSQQLRVSRHARKQTHLSLKIRPIVDFNLPFLFGFLLPHTASQFSLPSAALLFPVNF
jgi:hypothetical protein